MSTTVSTLGTLRQRLRQDTDDIHQMLHQNAAMLRLMSDDCSFSEYMDVLRVFFVFYVRGEYLYRSVPDEQRFIHEVRPLEWLQKDFALAGIAPPSPGLYGVSPENSVELASALESYIGYLYVKQGSTLGGQAISKRLQKSLALEGGKSQFFFDGFGARTRDMWTEFLQYLSHVEVTIDVDAVLLSARNHFSNLHFLFTQSFAVGGKIGYR